MKQPGGCDSIRGAGHLRVVTCSPFFFAQTRVSQDMVTYVEAAHSALPNRIEDKSSKAQRHGIRCANCHEIFYGRTPSEAESRIRRHSAREEPLRLIEVAARKERANKNLFGPPSPELGDWMELKAQQRADQTLLTQIERARKKGSSRTLVPLDVLERLVSG